MYMHDIASNNDYDSKLLIEINIKIFINDRHDQICN